MSVKNLIIFDSFHSQKNSHFVSKFTHIHVIYFNLGFGALIKIRAKCSNCLETTEWSNDQIVRGRVCKTDLDILASLKNNGIGKYPGLGKSQKFVFVLFSDAL